MSKRVRQWSFIGVLYHLHAVPDEHVQLAFDQYHVKDLVLPAETPTSVNILGRYLSPEVIPFIIDNYPGGRESMSLSTLSAKLSAREVNIYDGTTCVEFHKLLIATLIGYAKSLRIVDPQTKAVHAVTAVYGYALLLWELTKSGAFRHHMALLADAKLLNLPRYDDLGAYLSFAGEYGVPWDDKTDKASKIAEAEAKATAMRKVIAATRRAMSKIGLGWPKRNGRGNGEGEGEGEKEGEELPEATPTPTNAIDDADTEEGNAEKIESQAIASQVMESHGQQTKAKNLEVAYRRYVGMHVSYFGAASILSQFSEYLAAQELGEAPFAARIINTEQRRGQVSLHGIIELLKRLAAEQSPSGQKDIEDRAKKYEEVVRAVAHTPGISSAYAQVRKLFDGSGGSPQKLHNLMGAVHCETELAGLLRFGKMLPASMLTGSLREVLQVRVSCMFDISGLMYYTAS
jgi:hypothetical protein